MVDRRRFLSGLSASGLLWPLLKAFPLQAQTGAAKAKLIFVSPPGPWHVNYRDLLPAGLRDGSTEATRPIAPDDELPAALRTRNLSPAKRALYQRSITLIDGLRQSGANECRGVRSHSTAAAMLTGRCNYQNAGLSAGEFFATGESVDQYVARRFDVPVLGMSIPHKSYTRVVGDHFLSYKPPETPGGRALRQIPVFSPQAAWELIRPKDGDTPGFSDVTRRQALLRRAESDIASLAGTMPTVDRDRLQLHVNRLTELAESFEARPTATSCGEGLSIGQHDHNDPRDHVPMMMDYARIMVEALACGYTRVGYLQWGHLTGGGHRIDMPEYGINSHVRHQSSGYNQNVTWHGLAHLTAGMGGAGNGFEDRNGSVPQQIRQVARPLAIGANQVTNSHFAELLHMLEQTPDVDGGTLLDNTLVVQFRPMATNHSSDRIAWLIAGGRNLGVRQGRYLRLASRSGGGTSEHFHNDMLTAICRAMGFDDVDSYGLANRNKRAISL